MPTRNEPPPPRPPPSFFENTALQSRLLAGVAVGGGAFGLLMGVAYAQRGSSPAVPGATRVALKAFGGATATVALVGYGTVQAVKYSMGVNNVSFVCCVVCAFLVVVRCCGLVLRFAG